MQIGILDYELAVPTSVNGPADIFAALLRTYPLVRGKALDADFRIDFITERKGVFCRRGFQEKDRARLKRERYDLIIVPAMSSNRIEEVVGKQSRLINWLRKQFSRGTNLASICVGSFLLAATGLLDGKKATTNWMFADLFREKYPLVSLEDDKVIVDQGRIYTCGGAFCFTTFIIYLIEKFYGHDIAITASKILMINMHQLPQNSFSIFRFQKEHADQPVADVQEYMERNYAKNITMTEMAGIGNMSGRNLIRRFQQATGNTPLEYLQRFRMETAKKMLETKKLGIEQVALEAGYADMSFFRKVFKRHVGMTPKEYKDKYGREALKQRR